MRSSIASIASAFVSAAAFAASATSETSETDWAVAITVVSIPNVLPSSAFVKPEPSATTIVSCFVRRDWLIVLTSADVATITEPVAPSGRWTATSSRVRFVVPIFVDVTSPVTLIFPFTSISVKNLCAIIEKIFSLIRFDVYLYKTSINFTKC